MSDPQVVRATVESRHRGSIGWTALVAAAFLAVFPLDANAQSAGLPTTAPPPQSPGAGPDAVYLRNGAVIFGWIEQSVPGQFVVVRTPDGRTITVSWIEVLSVQMAPRSAGSLGVPGALAVQNQPGPQGYGLDMQASLPDAEAKRRAWAQKGGALVGYELRINGMYVRMPESTLMAGTDVYTVFDHGGIYANREVENVKHRGYGGGGGVGTRASLLYLSLPDPGSGSTWSAFRLGAGADVAFAYLKYPVLEIRTIGPTYYPREGLNSFTSTQTIYQPEYESMSLFLLSLPVNVGYQVGFGTFDGTRWTGVSLGIAYSPSLNVAKVKDADASTTFNWAGAEVTFDILGEDGPLEADAQPAHIRFSAFVLPPVDDESPLVVTGGFGAVWY